MRRGELIGYVLDDDAASVRIIVPQSEIELVRDDTRGVDLRFASRPMRVLHVGQVTREVPTATRQLPSVALASVGGGPIAVDPTDEQHLRALEVVFQMDVKLPEGMRRSSHRRTRLCALPARRPDAGLAHRPHRSAVVPAAVRSMSAATTVHRLAPHRRRRSSRGRCRIRNVDPTARHRGGPPARPWPRCCSPSTASSRPSRRRRVARLAADLRRRGRTIDDTPDAIAALRARLRAGITPQRRRTAHSH